MSSREFEVFDPLKPTGEFIYNRSPSEAKAALICLHGFSGSPWETRPLAEFMYTQGYACFCPLLPGHGAKERNIGKKLMNQLTTTQMFKFVRDFIHSKRAAGYNKVFLYGQSMGGIITLALAGEGIVDAAAETVAPLHLPLIFKWISHLFAPMNAALNISKPPAEKGWSYEFLSARSAVALLGMIDYARSMIAQIEIPIFGVYSKKDILPARTGKYLTKFLGTKIKIDWFNESGHVMLLDKQSTEIMIAISSFFEKQL